MTDQEIRDLWPDSVRLSGKHSPAIYEFARLVAAREREACAALVEEACVHVGCTAAEAEGLVRRTRDALADAIRKRGES